MKKLIYYPGFDVQDENWLKFALLYLDEICPIIPNSGNAHRNPTTKSIMLDTDLINPYRPENEAFLGLNMSKKAAHIYMSLLADEIANRHDIDSITDDVFNNKLILNKTKEHNKKNKLDTIERAIKLELPRNINLIDIKDIIKLRSNPKFNDLRKIYVNEVTKKFDYDKHFNNNLSLMHGEIAGCSKEFVEFMLSALGTSASLILTIESFGLGLMASLPLMATTLSKWKIYNKKK